MKKTVVTLIASLVVCQVALADSLVITDTTGVTRAEQALTTEEPTGSVQFSVVDAQGNPGDGFDVLLRNEATGETMTASAVGGSVVFEAVPSGTWVVSTTASGVTFTGVTVAPTAMAGALGGMGISSGVIVVGGVGAVAATSIAIAESNNNNDDEMSPSS